MFRSPRNRTCQSFSAWKSRSDFLLCAEMPTTEERSRRPRLPYIAVSILGTLSQ